ncbi:MAG: hypothetical protein P1P88_01040 [Bacteroidales bacterium]|nr:hypothetical protein [Bacteroidales bacterium]
MTASTRARARLRVGLPASQKNAVRNELLLQVLELRFWLPSTPLRYQKPKP